MQPVLQKTFVLMTALLLLASCQTRKADIGHVAVPNHALENKLSTNWMAAARAALPEKYLEKGDLSFQEITNLLCCESRLGNDEAKGLWGCALLVQSSSPKEAESGLQLLRKSADDGCVAAMLTLGSLFEGGQYVSKDYK